MSVSIKALYAARAAAGDIEPDPAQQAAVERLDLLNARLANYRLARKSSSLGWLLGKRDSDRRHLKGLYMFGEVGRGKTMLMDMFFDTCPVKLKRRVHFHEFMAETQDRINDYRRRIKTGEVKDEDPITLVAADVADTSLVLCFDEFHVTDIADAMILGRLFTRLFNLGVVVVATSNVAPENLYSGGLNRGLFLPFIALMQERLDVMRLNSRTDFRMEKIAGGKVWYVPADAAADAAIDDAWKKLIAGQAGAPADLPVKGRFVHVPMAALGTARFSFHDLCEKPLGAIDYLKIAHDFHTVIVEHIPVIRAESRNEAKRFILLIDTFYDSAVKIIASAATEPAKLFLGTEGYEAMEFQRTISRLNEMGSEAYLALPHGRHADTAAASKEGIVET
jgi:cell division protein ZapE